MSIINLIKEEEERNELVKGTGGVLKTIAGFGGLGFVGYNALKDDVGKELKNIVKGSQRSLERGGLGEAGTMVKSSIDRTFERRKKRELKSSSAFFDDLTKEANNILKRSVSREVRDSTLSIEAKEAIKKEIVNEKIYLLTAVRDYVKESGVDTQTVTLLDELLGRELDKASSVNSSAISNIENILKEINKSEPDLRISEMKRFRGLKESSRFFSGSTKALGLVESGLQLGKPLKRERVVKASFEGAFEEAMNIANRANPKAGFYVSDRFGDVKHKRKNLEGLFGMLEKDLSSFKKEVASIGGSISGFRLIQEYEGEIPSIYAQVSSTTTGRVVEQPIYYSRRMGEKSRTKGFNPIARASKSMNAPFIAPNIIIDPVLSERLTKGNMSLTEASRALNFARPEKYIRQTFVDLIRNSAGGSFDAISQMDLDQLFAHHRSLMETVNKGTLAIPDRRGSILTKGTIGHLNIAQSLAASSAVIIGATGSRKKDVVQLPRMLMTKYPELFDAPAGSKVDAKEFKVPHLGNIIGYNVNVVGNVGMDGKVEPVISPLTLMKRVGLRDRGTQPLTAREMQFFGREDYISQIYAHGSNAGVTEGTTRVSETETRAGNFFGRSKNKDRKLSIIASNSALLGVDENMVDVIEKNRLGSVKGANFSGLMFFDNRQVQAMGLAEGQALHGGVVEVTIPLQKTILSPEEMKLPQYDFLRYIAEEQKKRAQSGKKARIRFKKELEIIELFKRFGNKRGEIPIGVIDDREVTLKRFGNVSDYIFGVEEIISDKYGTTKIQFSAEARMRDNANKLFGPMAKTTGGGLRPLGSAAEVIESIKQGLSADDSYAKAFGGAQAAAETVHKIMTEEFGGVTKNLLITGSGTIDKSIEYLSGVMMGGFRQLGGLEATRQKIGEGLGIFDPKKVEDFARSLISKEAGTEVRRGVSAFERNRASFILNTQAMLKSLKQDVPELFGKDKASAQTLALLTGGLRYVEKDTPGKLGVKTGDYTKHILGMAELENVDKGEMEKMLSTRLMYGAQSGFSGSPPQIYGRNMAKFEPRHANFIFHGLKTFFGMNSQNSIKYLNDFIIRQQGVEFSGKYLPDVFNIGLSMTKDMSQFMENYSSLPKMTRNQFDTLLLEAEAQNLSDRDSFRRKLVGILDPDSKVANQLAMSETPMILNFKELLRDEDDQARRLLEKAFPTGEIVLPSAKTIAGMKNYQIKRGDRVENIDQALIGEIKSTFENISNILNPGARPAESSVTSILGSKRRIQEISGTALRRALSGAVLGSVSTQGTGFIPSSKLSTMSDEVFQNASSFLEKNQGYGLMLDTRAFMDSLDTFMGAKEKSNILYEKAESPEKARINLLKDFMFEHLEGNASRRVLALRNPSFFITHLDIGTAIGRMDINSAGFDILSTLGEGSRAKIESLLTPEMLARGQQRGANQELVAFQEGMQGKFNEGKVSSLQFEDIYRAEKAFEQDASLAKNFRIKEEISSFNQNMTKFFGTGFNPITMSDLNDSALNKQQELITSNISNRNAASLKDAERNLNKLNSLRVSEKNLASSVFRGVYNETIENFGAAFGQGGGKIIFPEYNAKVTLEKLGTGDVSTQTSRFDYVYSKIGDFDADIYQLFHETSDLSVNAMAQNQREIVGRIARASGEFNIIRNLTNEAFDTLAKRLGTGEMNLTRFMTDQATKELNIKSGVGQIDVPMKSLLLGIMANINEKGATESRKAAGTVVGQTLDILSSSLFIPNIQESGVIKSKKLPFASDIGEVLARTLNYAYKTGDTTKFLDALSSTVFEHSPMKGKGVKVKGVDLVGLDLKQVQQMYSESLEGITISQNKIFEELEAGIKTTRELGLQFLGSENKLVQGMNTLSGAHSKAFYSLVAGRNSLETSMLGEFDTGAVRSSADRIDSLTEMVTDRLESISKVNKGIRANLSGKGMAGLIGAGLVASYGLGADYSTSSFSGPSQFSDAKVKNQIGSRAVYNNFHRQHRDVSASSMEHPTNLYERPIIQNQMHVNRTSSNSFRGEVRDLNNGRNIVNNVSKAGGKGILMIQDGRRPLPNMIDNYLMD